MFTRRLINHVLFLFNKFYNFKIKLNFLNSYEIAIMFQRVKVLFVLENNKIPKYSCRWAGIMVGKRFIAHRPFSRIKQVRTALTYIR